MRSSPGEIVRLGHRPRRSLASNIEARHRLLQAWLENGVPNNVVVPSSLTKVRTWDIPGLGIYPIGSPVGFTRGNAVHGAGVRKIEELLQRLSAATATKGKDHQQALPSKPAEEQADLSYIVAQWHAERARVIVLENNLRFLEAKAVRKEAALVEQIAGLDRTVADLKRDIAALRKLRSVK